MNEVVVIGVAAVVTVIVVTRLAVLLNAANRAGEVGACRSRASAPGDP